MDPTMATTMPVSGGLGGQQATGGQGNIGGLGAQPMPGQNLNYSNMLYNANNSSQAGMNMAQNAATFNPSGIQQEMNPYVNSVVNAANQQSWQNFNQQQVPTLQSAFGGTGQFGSARADQSMQQASNQNALQNNWQQAQLMNTGYNQAQQNYQHEQNIGLQGAQTMGSLGTQAANQATNQAMLPANQAAVYSGALGNLKTPTFSQSSGAQQTPYYFAPTY